MNNKTFALEYAKAGFKIFPLWWIDASTGKCACGDADCGGPSSKNNPGKHPIAGTPAKWIVRNGRKDSSNDVNKVAEWWSLYPKANIGLDCQGNNLFVVDVDLHDGDKNGFESIDDWETTFKDKIISSITQETGGGGQHLIFKAPAGLTSAPSGTGKNYPGIDFKFNGYILMTPSNHKSGAFYHWADERSKDNFFNKNIPELPKSIAKFIADSKDENQYSPVRYTAPSRIQDEDDIEQMRDALNCMSPFGMSDDEMLKVGMGLQQTLPGGAGKALYFDWLSSNLGSRFNLKSSERRWRSFKYRSGGRTIASFYETAAAQGFVNEGKRGTYVNPEDFVFMEPTLVSNKFESSSLKNLSSMLIMDNVMPPMTIDLEQKAPVMMVDMHEQPTITNEPDKFIIPSQPFKGDACMNDLYNAVKKINNSAPDPNKGMPTQKEWEEWNSRLGNNRVLCSLFRHQIENNTCFIPELALGFTLSTIGGLLAGRFKLENLTSNLYIMCICATSIGKSQTFSMMSNVYAFAGDGVRFGPKDIVSDKGFYNDLQIDKARMFPIDEIGELFSTIFSPRANPSQQSIKRGLLDGFTAYGTEFNKTASKADNKNNPVVNLGRICPSVFGLTTPSKIWDALSGKDIIDGMLNRLFVLTSDNATPTGKDSMQKDLPKEFTEWFYQIKSRWQAGGIMPIQGTDIVSELKIHNEAKVLISAIKDIETDKKRKDEKYGLIWARMTEITKRVSIIIELTERPHSGMIHKDSIETAFQLVHWALTNTEQVARTKIADSEEESIMKEVFELVKKSPNGIFYEQLTEKTRLAGNLKIRAQIIGALKDEQKIKEFSFKQPGQRGRPKKLFVTPENLMKMDTNLRVRLSDTSLEI